MSRSTSEYYKKFQRQIKLCVNRKTEPKLLAWLENKENVSGYIKGLICTDMIANNSQPDIKQKVPQVLRGQLMVDDDCTIRTVDTE